MLKRFFISTLATITGLWISFGLFFFLGMMLIGLAASVGETETVDVKNNSILHVRLYGSVVERYQPSTFIDEVQGNNGPTFALDEAIAAIKYAADDNKFEGIYLECDGLSAAPASLAEIKQALDYFKASGKWIVAYSDNYSQGDYFLAACADKVMVNPIGGIDIHGLSATTLYFKDLLDKLGVEAQIFKVGTYKSAVEPFMISSMSDANREQQVAYLGSIWDYTISAIAADRNIAKDYVNQNADSLLAFESADEAVNRRFADFCAYKHQAKEELMNRVGVDDEDELQLITPRQLCASVDMPHSKDNNNKIAVLYAYGDIVDSGSEGIVGPKVVKQIEEITEDDNIGGLVFRVNSGGGSAFASEQIWEALERFKATGRPLYVSMGDYAASGGYYISCGADSIFALPTTLTGSIGIFGIIPCVEKTMKEKLGVNPQSVATNENAGFSLMQSLTPQQRKQFQKNVERGYETFTGRCADGRGMTKDDIKAIAEGRVWVGSTALQLGLIDGFASLDDVIAKMADTLLYSDYQVVAYPKLKTDFWETWEEMKEDQVNAALKEQLGDNYMIYKQIHELQNMNPMQCRMDKVIIK